MKDDLARAIERRDEGGFVVGNVSGTSPVEVTIDGQSGLTASYLNSYTPNVNDLVLIYRDETDYCIIGLIISGG